MLSLLDQHQYTSLIFVVNTLIWSHISFSEVTPLGVISFVLVTSCETQAVQYYIKCKLIFPSTCQMRYKLQIWFVSFFHLSIFSAIVLCCVKGAVQTLTASEPIQSSSAECSKESFVAAHLNNSPKTRRVDFAHFGPVSSDHPQCVFFGSHLLPAWPAHCLTAAIPEHQRWNFTLPFTLASEHKAVSFIGRWLTTDRTSFDHFADYCMKGNVYSGSRISVSFVCLEDFCMLAIISVFKPCDRIQELQQFYFSC